MRSVSRALAVTLAVFAGFAVVLSVPGWLYLIQPRPAFPGPPLATALPLDELSRRSAVPLLIFVAVWATAGLVLGLLVRAARIDRLTAALGVALAVGTWTYVTTAISILVVRQVPTLQAFHAAARLPAVYLPAALAGLGAAVMGSQRARLRHVAPHILSLLVAFAGVFDVLVGLFPEYHMGGLQAFAPQAVEGIATALLAPIGLGLIVIARGLARRKRRAWLLAVALLSGSAALHLLHRVTYGATATALVALALIARRDDFSLRGERAQHARSAVRAVVLAGVVYAYGAASLWMNRVMADQPFSARFAFRETTTALLGLNVRGSSHLSGDFGQWFPVSIVFLGGTAAAFVLAGWLAPWRARVREEANERALARVLVASWGVDTLAPFALRKDKSYFFSIDRRAFLAYRVVAGVAIVAGDPVGPVSEFDNLVRRFIEFAHERDWRLAILGVSEERLDLYRAHGLHALYHGDEAVVDVRSFSLDGRPIRKVRQSVTRLQLAGYRADVMHPGEIGPELRDELERIAGVWRGAEPERGFVMALDALFRLEDEDAVFVIGRDPGGEPAGFLHFAISRPGFALSLSSMPRLATTPNGFNEWLVCEAVAWAREHDFTRVSLNFAPFAALLAPHAELSRLQHVERRALIALKGRFQLDNLLVFNRKFLPGWQRRFVVYERRRDLPRIGLAALAAEAYLPFSGRGRG